MLSFHKYYYGVILFFIILIIFESIVSGKASFVTESQGFDSAKAYKHLLQFTKSPRYIGTTQYNETNEYIMDYLWDISSNATNKFTYLTEDSGIRYLETNILGFQKQMRTVVVKFLVSNDELNTLYISAHIDSHNVGPSAYDDGINCAVMLELIKHVSQFEKPLDYNLIFIFQGGEEHGLQGSTAYIHDHNPKGYLLNLESLGIKRPFMLPTKSKDSSSVIKSLIKSKGIVFATFFNDIMGTGIVKSTSDLRNFEKNGVAGAELVFSGNPTAYHTRFDVVQGESDLEHEGNIILRFIKEFTPEEEKLDGVALGISPFVIYISRQLLEKVIITSAIATLSLVYKMSTKNNVVSFFKILGLIIVILILNIVLAFDINRKNPCSYGDDVQIAIVLLPLISISLFAWVIVQFFFKSNNFVYARLVLDVVLCFVSCKIETGLIPLLLLFTSIIQYFTKSVVLSTVVEIPISFWYTMMIRTFIQYTPNINGFLADVLCFAVASFYGIHIALTASANSHNDDEDIMNSFGFHSSLLISILSVSYLLAKSEPYSETYPIKGSFAHYTYDNGTSYCSYHPESGQRTIKHLKEVSNLKSKYLTRGFIAGQAIYENATMPEFIERWPKLDIRKEGRSVTFHVDNEVEAEMMAVFACCRDTEKCVSKVGGFNSSEHHRFGTCESGVLTRIFPIGTSDEISMEFSNNADVEIMFTWSRLSESLKRFRKKFPSYVTHYSKNTHFADTVLVFTRTINV